MTSRGISVIICCYNSSLRLPETLKHIASQNVQVDLLWEVIIVDNASKDDTATVAAKEWRKYDLPLVEFKIINEQNPGLSFARNRGISESSFEFILFCDDDNWLDQNYLSVAFRLLADKPDIGVLGGQSTALTDGSFPDWFETYKAAYVVGKQNTVSGDISARGYLWGAGMAFRKTYYQRAFSRVPSLLTDRKGASLVSGGDSEICKRFLLLGLKLHYSEMLEYTHFIPNNRFTINYRDGLLKGFSEAKEILDKYSEMIHIKHSSFFKQSQYFLASIIKLSILKLLKVKKWDREREIRWIFFLTNWKVVKDDVAIKIKEVSQL
jgi:glycosyltransferase involved in cell wall biosynthesis